MDRAADGCVVVVKTHPSLPVRHGDRFVLPISHLVSELVASDWFPII